MKPTQENTNLENKVPFYKAGTRAKKIIPPTILWIGGIFLACFCLGYMAITINKMQKLSLVSDQWEETPQENLVLFGFELGGDFSEPAKNILSNRKIATTLISNPDNDCRYYVVKNSESNCDLTLNPYTLINIGRENILSANRFDADNQPACFRIKKSDDEFYSTNSIASVEFETDAKTNTLVSIKIKFLDHPSEDGFISAFNTKYINKRLPTEWTRWYISYNHEHLYDDHFPLGYFRATKNRFVSVMYDRGEIQFELHKYSFKKYEKLLNATYKCFDYDGWFDLKEFYRKENEIRQEKTDRAKKDFSNVFD